MFYMLLFIWACTGDKKQMIFYYYVLIHKTLKMEGAYFFFFTMTPYKIIENQAKISLSFSCGPLE